MWLSWFEGLGWSCCWGNVQGGWSERAVANGGQACAYLYRWWMRGRLRAGVGRGERVGSGVWVLGVGRGQRGGVGHGVHVGLGVWVLCVGRAQRWHQGREGKRVAARGVSHRGRFAHPHRGSCCCACCCCGAWWVWARGRRRPPCLMRVHCGFLYSVGVGTAAAAAAAAAANVASDGAAPAAAGGVDAAAGAAAGSVHAGAAAPAAAAAAAAGVEAEQEDHTRAGLLLVMHSVCFGGAQCPLW